MDMTKQELAELAGITYRQLYNINRKLAEEDDDKALFVPGSDPKKCDAGAFVRRWVEYNVERASVDAGDLDAIKAQHEAVKMRKTQFEVDRLEGELVAAQDVKKLWGDLSNTVMQGLLRLPSAIAPLVRGLDSVEIIGGIMDAEIRKTLESLAETPLPDYLLAQNEDDDEP